MRSTQPMETTMLNTIYATFNTEGDAERAAGALMDHGVGSEHISFILPQLAQATAAADLTLPPISEPAPSASIPAPSAPAAAPEDIPIADVAVPPPPRLENVPAGEIQDSRTMPPSQAPPSGYTYDALGALIPDTSRPKIVPRAASPVAMPADTPIDVVNADHAHMIDMNRREPTAASGISTTTGGDAAKGALEGAGIGLGLGVILGLAAIAIPGIGLVAGAGALVAGLAAATGAAGGIAGGVYGYLSDMGLPPETARRLSEHLRAGGPVLSIEVTDAVPPEEIVGLLRKYGATSAEAF